MPPTASAGGPYAATYGDGLTLDASASSDADGDGQTYAWTINGQANAATGVQPTLSWASLASLGLVSGQSYAVSVTVNAGHGYAVTSAGTTITVNKATPVFSAVGTTVITDGTPSVTLSGTLSHGSFIPTGSVTVTLDGVSQMAAIGAGGSFSATFATASLSVGAHSVSFNYAGDANFTDASAGGSLDGTYGILALFNQGRAAHPGSTLPIQIALDTAAGQDVSSAGVTVTALGIAATADTTDLVGAVDPSAVGTLTPAQAAGGSSTDNSFLFQGGAHPSYSYNLKIPKGLAAGTYRLYFSVAGDPLDHWVLFTVG